MNGERSIDVYDADPAILDLVNETQISGNRIVFKRDGRPVALLVNNDEYLALRETLLLCARPAVSARIEESRGQLKRGMVDEELSGGKCWIAEAAVAGLDGEERAAAGNVGQALAEDPIAGVPLFEPFTGLWCRLAENLRMIYELSPQGTQIGILFIERTGN